MESLETIKTLVVYYAPHIAVCAYLFLIVLGVIDALEKKAKENSHE